jgi:hypothetical protein
MKNLVWIIVYERFLFIFHPLAIHWQHSEMYLRVSQWDIRNPCEREWSSSTCLLVAFLESSRLACLGADRLAWWRSKLRCETLCRGTQGTVYWTQPYGYNSISHCMLDPVRSSRFLCGSQNLSGTLTRVDLGWGLLLVGRCNLPIEE